MSSHAHSVHHSEAPQGFIRHYIFSLDHKIIGTQYILLGLSAVTIGMILSLIVRLHLVWPNLHIWGFANGVVSPEDYLRVVTMHGTLMVFFVLTTVPQSGFGNYFLPIQIGAPDMAFPRINMLSFWFTFLALLVLLSSAFVPGGAPISGWTSYTPLSALGQIAGPGQGMGETLWVTSIALFCGASLMSAINFLATTIDLRAKGLSLMRMPLTVWGWFITACLALLAFGVLLAACILLLLDRLASTSFFIPGGLSVSGQLISNHSGGSPLLWQHLFWFFGHPEVYIAILPGMGIISHVLSTFSRKPVFGYKAMVYSLSAIGFLSFAVWGHHMFISGMNPYSALAFSVLTLVIGVPSAIKTFNWLGTLWGGRIHFTTAMLFAIGFVSLFVTGGLSGIFLAQPALDLYLHATYYVIGHFHIIMGVAAIFAMFAASYYWFPKMFGHHMSETLGKWHFWCTFVGVYCIFMPMHYLGYAGDARRYSSLESVNYMIPLHPVHMFITISALFTASAQLLFYWNFFWSMKHGKPAAQNPWNATTLEWSVPTPVPHDNFGGKFPTVYRGPYEYSVPGMKDDFVPQHLAPELVAKA